jgi:hypothetical protein
VELHPPMKRNTRHCIECNREFVPDPRVGRRQVTCGRPSCQRKRHAHKCRQWHEQHPKSKENHYHDGIVPFRKQHPDYQRIWRWLRRIREIREKLTRLLDEVQRLINAERFCTHALTENDVQVPETTKQKINDATLAEAGIEAMIRALFTPQGLRAT